MGFHFIEEHFKMEEWLEDQLGTPATAIFCLAVQGSNWGSVIVVEQKGVLKYLTYKYAIYISVCGLKFLLPIVACRIWESFIRTVHPDDIMRMQVGLLPLSQWLTVWVVICLGNFFRTVSLSKLNLYKLLVLLMLLGTAIFCIYELYHLYFYLLDSVGFNPPPPTNSLIDLFKYDQPN